MPKREEAPEARPDPRWSKEAEENLLRTPEGKLLRDLLADDLRLVSGDVNDSCGPVGMMKRGDGKSVSAGEARERGVWAHGQQFQLERILAVFFGGVP